MYIYRSIYPYILIYNIYINVLFITSADGPGPHGGGGGGGPHGAGDQGPSGTSGMAIVFKNVPNGIPTVAEALFV